MRACTHSAAAKVIMNGLNGLNGLGEADGSDMGNLAFHDNSGVILYRVIQIKSIIQPPVPAPAKLVDY